MSIKLIKILTINVLIDLARSWWYSLKKPAPRIDSANIINLMRTLFILLLATVGFGAVAQSAAHASRSADWRTAEQTRSVAMVSNSQVPYQETVEEDQAEGRLKVRFTFIIDGQENIVERTAIIRDTTEAGRRKLREEIEHQLTAEMDALVGSVSGV